MEELNGLVSGARQLIVVSSGGWDDTEATLRLYARYALDSDWLPASTGWEVALGKNGMAWGRGMADIPKGATNHKAEGDNKAPAGLFSLGTAFGYPGRPEDISWPYQRLEEHHFWVDDPTSAYYNQLVNTNEHKHGLRWKSAEKMLREDGLYTYGLAVEHNTTGILPGGGSAIFMHIWRGAGQGTEGCTAMPENRMLELLQWLKPRRHPLLLQLPGEIMPEAKYYLGIK